MGARGLRGQRTAWPAASSRPDVPQSSCTEVGAPALIARAAAGMLEAAARDVLLSWESGPGEALVENVDVQLNGIVEAVREATGTGQAPHIEVAPWLPARRLVDALRRSFLVRARASIHPVPDVLRFLDALERVEQRIEQDMSQRFRSRLAGPDALELLTEVAHDLRSPLTSILILVESMRRGSDRLPLALERRLGLVYGAAFGLSTLAENLFDLARGADLVLEPQPIVFSLEETMHAVRDIALPIAEEKGLVFEFQRCGVDCRIGHPHALQRVLLNLATNALKFTTTGFVRFFATDIGGPRVLFEVRDSGPGIGADTLEGICSAFRPVPHSGRVAFSTPGLGLSICEKLVTSMGSTLGVRSFLGLGTHFFFQLDLPIPAHD